MTRHKSIYAMAMFTSLALGTSFFFQSSLATAGPDEEDELAQEKAAVKRVVAENCQLCHSSELIHAQRLTPAQWKAEVEKMVGWGAPLAVEDRTKVTEYLAEEFPAKAPKKATQLITLREALIPEQPEAEGVDRSTGDLAAGEARFLKDCATCHGKNGQGADLGPNLVEKPVLFQAKHFHKIVKDGLGRMPAFKDQWNESANQNVLKWLGRRRFQVDGG